MIFLSTCQNSEAVLNSDVLLRLHVSLTFQIDDTMNILSTFKQQRLDNTQLVHFKYLYLYIKSPREYKLRLVFICARKSSLES